MCRTHSERGANWISNPPVLTKASLLSRRIAGMALPALHAVLELQESFLHGKEKLYLANTQ